ncbi:MAG TPA: hypothetical protein VGW75_15205 [Solirubrobacteraceae bacterium]|jgi:hypothetical protein|nr:hypothetical protein [Solirubrobacteraceae bacterium]
MITKSPPGAALPRSTVELLDLPFSFTQLPLLTGDKFIRAARERGVHLTDEQLEGFHRLGLLVPLLRFRRDGRAIWAAGRRDRHLARQLAHQPTRVWELRAGRAAGRLFDARVEPFVARRRLERRVGRLRYHSSAFLYSKHQLVSLDTVRQALPYLRYRGRDVVGLDVRRSWLDVSRSEAGWVADTILAVLALEACYYPDIVRSLRLDGESYREYERWRRRLPLTAMLKWLGVDAEWLRDRAAGLLQRADRVDPLGGWFELVREAEPISWKRLKGSARNAVDIRIAAEVLLRYHDALVRGRRAKRLLNRRACSAVHSTRV